MKSGTDQVPLYISKRGMIFLARNQDTTLMESIVTVTSFVHKNFRAVHHS